MTVTQSPDEVLRHQKEKETVCPGPGVGLEGGEGRGPGHDRAQRPH